MDYPLQECADQARELIERGALVFQKFTCSKCGARQMIEEPNVFYTTASCEECGAMTDIQKDGCNYLVLMGVQITP